MRRTPRAVVLVARTHWTVGLVIVVSIGALHLITRNLPAVEFGRKTYLITGSLAVLYLMTGSLVWFGAPLGRLLSRICGLLYLPRPRFGGMLWELMNTPEYQAHFEGKPTEQEAEPTKHTNHTKKD
jgi:hypothetical protein